jgi:hypothetical protein
MEYAIEGETFDGSDIYAYYNPDQLVMVEYPEEYASDISLDESSGKNNARGRYLEIRKNSLD